jgi:hypothetical protein
MLPSKWPFELGFFGLADPQADKRLKSRMKHILYIIVSPLSDLPKEETYRNFKRFIVLGIGNPAN